MGLTTTLEDTARKFDATDADIREDDVEQQGTAGRVMYRRSGNAPLRVTTIVAMLCALISLSTAGLLLLNPIAPGLGAHSEGPQRGLVALVTAAIFAVFSFFLWRYSRMIVCEMLLLPGEMAIRVSSATITGRHHREVALSSVSLLEPHGGDEAGEAAFSGSWLKILINEDRSMLVPLDGSAEDIESMVSSLRRLCSQKQKRQQASAIH